MSGLPVPQDDILGLDNFPDFLDYSIVDAFPELGSPSSDEFQRTCFSDSDYSPAVFKEGINFGTTYDSNMLSANTINFDEPLLDINTFFGLESDHFSPPGLSSSSSRSSYEFPRSDSNASHFIENDDTNANFAVPRKFRSKLTQAPRYAVAANPIVNRAPSSTKRSSPKHGKKRKSAASDSSRAAFVQELPNSCLHCGATDTAQWRDGPLGPKSLCNPCGLRFDKGTLYPEYMPAAMIKEGDRLNFSSVTKEILQIRKRKELSGIVLEPIMKRSKASAAPVLYNAVEEI